MGEGSADRLPPAVAAPLGRSWTEAEAFDYCTRMTKSHYENFPVGSLLAPPALQPAVHSLYAFMRTADDFSDEDRSAGDEAQRSAWLSTWEGMLAECEKGQARHPIFIALRRTLEQYRLPVVWLRDLLTAFQMDVTVHRYAAEADLLNYCRYSANPVGRLILTLFGFRDDELYRLSDAICTGLQLANHWQDVAVDLRKDRIYLPQSDLTRFGVMGDWLFQQLDSESISHSRTEKAQEERWKSFYNLMSYEVNRARAFFKTGRPLPERVRGRLRWELRLTWHGGSRTLDKIEQVGYDVFRSRPTVTRWDWAQLAVRSLVGL